MEAVNSGGGGSAVPGDLPDLCLLDGYTLQRERPGRVLKPEGRGSVPAALLVRGGSNLL